MGEHQEKDIAMAERVRCARKIEAQAKLNYQRGRDEAILRGAGDRLASAYFCVGSALEAMASMVLNDREPYLERPNHAHPNKDKSHAE